MQLFNKDVTMILYEVNIDIKANIFDEYIKWLENHIKEMLLIDGFLRAKTFQNFTDIQESKNKDKQVIVQYEVQCLDKLNQYFNNQASKMRTQTRDLFGNNLVITRRVLKLCSEVSDL